MKSITKKFFSALTAVSVLSLGLGYSQFAPAASAADTTALFENFEDYELGSIKSDANKALAQSRWSQLNNGGDALFIIKDPLNENNQVAKFWDDSEPNYITVRKSTGFDNPLIINGKYLAPSDDKEAPSLTFGLRTTVGAPVLARFDSGGTISYANNGGMKNSGVRIIKDKWINLSIAVHANADPAQSKIYVHAWGDGVERELNAVGTMDLTGVKFDSTLVRFDCNNAQSVLMDDVKISNAPTFDITMPQTTNVTGKSVNLIFNHDIDPTSFTADKITVTNTSTNVPAAISDIAFNSSFTGATLTLANDVSADSVYKIDFAPGVYDICHNSPSTNVYFSTSDTAPPNPDRAPVVVDGIKIEPSELDLKLGFEQRFTGKNLYTPDTLCQLKTTVYPLTADDQTLEWYSDNEQVVTIDKDTGNIRTVGEGTTTVYAKAKDGSGVTSNKTTVNVGPGYDTAMQKMCLSDEKLPIDVDTCLAWPTEVGTPQVALWKNNNTGAFSITIDDGITGDFDRWIAMSNKYGFKFTFYIPGISLDGNSIKEPTKKLIANGMDVSSHTYNHVSTEEQGTFVSGWWFEDLGHAVRVLRDQYGVKAKTIGYSYGTLGPNVLKSDNADYMHEYHIAARGTGGGVNIPGQTDYDFISSSSMFGNQALRYTTRHNSMEGMIKTLYDRNYWLNNANENNIGGWINIHSHGIDATGWAIEDGVQVHAVNPDYGKPISVEEMLTDAFDNYLQPACKEGKVWADTFTNIAMYAQERDTAQVNVTNNTKENIKFTVTDKMNDEYFDFPLTVKFKVDNSWEKIGATQNGEPIEVIEKEIDGNKYIMVNAVPDMGEVVVTPNTAVETPAPSETPVPSETPEPSPTATPIPTPNVTQTPSVESDDNVLLSDSFDYYTTDGERVIDRPLPIPDFADSPVDIDSSAVKWSGGNLHGKTGDLHNNGIMLKEDPKDSSNICGAYWNYKEYNVQLHYITDTTKWNKLQIKGRVMLNYKNRGNSMQIRMRNGVTHKELLSFNSDSGTVSTIDDNNAARNYFGLDQWVNFDLTVNINHADLAASSYSVLLYGDNLDTKYLTSSVNLTDLIVNNTNITFFGNVPQDEVYQTYRQYIDDAAVIIPGALKMAAAESESISDSLTLYFSHNLVPDTVTPDAFEIKGADGNAVSITSAVQDTKNPAKVTLTFGDLGALTEQEYTVTVKDSLKDITGADGNGLTSVFTAGISEHTHAEVTSYQKDPTVYDGNDGKYSHAYRFIVTPNDDVITGVTLKVTNGIQITEGDLTKKFDTATISGGSAVFGIIATTDKRDATAPEFEISLD